MNKMIYFKLYRVVCRLKFIYSLIFELKKDQHDKDGTNKIVNYVKSQNINLLLVQLVLIIRSMMTRREWTFIYIFKWWWIITNNNVMMYIILLAMHMFYN